MNLLPMSFDSGVRQGHSSSEEDKTFDTIPAHLSPYASSRFNASQALVGLGISNFQMEPPSCQRVYPTSEALSQPVTQWPDQVAMLDPCDHPILDVDNLMPGMNYESLQRFGAVPVSFASASYYGGQAISAAGYEGTCGVLPSQEPVIQQSVTGAVDALSTSTTGTNKPLNNRTWVFDNSSIRIPETAGQIPQPTLVHPFDPSSFQFNSFQDSKPFAEWPAFQTQTVPMDQTSLSDTTDIQSLQNSLSSAPGLQCTICGYRFTRRSNCREHMKKHDPSSQKVHFCGICERPFGRRTDLNRHVDSVHWGVKRFGCEKCLRRFSRHDSLIRHHCQRRPRKTKAEKKQLEKEQQSQSSDDYFEDQRQLPDYQPEGFTIPGHGFTDGAIYSASYVTPSLQADGICMG